MRPTDFVPPIVTRAIRRIRPARPSYAVEGDYPSFEAAMAACDGGYHAYGAVAQQVASLRDHTLPARWVDARTQQLLSAMLGRAPNPAVLDFGGGIGQHFRALREHLRPRSWTVVETEIMVAEATKDETTKNTSDDALRFVTSLDAAGDTFDIALASGVLQFLPAPGEIFTALATKAPVLVLNRLSLLAGAADRLVVLRSPGAACPMWFLSESRFDAALQDSKMQVAMRWRVPQDVSVLDGRPVEYQGMVLVRVP